HAGDRGDGSQRFTADGNDFLDRGHDFDRDRAGPILARRLRNRAVRPQAAARRYGDRTRRDKHHRRPRHQRPLLHYRAAQALGRPTRGPPSLSWCPPLTILFVMRDEPSNISLVTYRRKNGVTFMTTHHAGAASRSSR